jgi:hypothetical protein
VRRERACCLPWRCSRQTTGEAAGPYQNVGGVRSYKQGTVAGRRARYEAIALECGSGAVGAVRVTRRALAGGGVAQR